MNMTVQQEAYSLIDTLSEDKVRLIVQVMLNMLPGKNEHDIPQSDKISETQKMNAFHQMQELRKESHKYPVPDFEAARAAGMEEKYGQYLNLEV